MGRTVVHVAVWPTVVPQFRLPLVKAQAERGNRVVVVAPLPAGRDASDALQAAGATLVPAELSVRPRPRLVAEMARLVALLRRLRADVVFAHQPMGALIAVPAARLARVPVAIYATGGLRFVPEDRDLGNRLLGVAERRIMALADATLLVNREDEELVQSWPTLAAKAYYVGPRGGCGIDGERFHPDRRARLRAAARAGLGIGEHELALGYAGRLVLEKGLADLVEALFAHAAPSPRRPLALLFLGEGKDRARLEARARSAPEGVRVLFPGYRHDIDACLSALDLFVLPSYREGLPVALLEAMGLGLPVVASRVRGSRELVRDGDTGYLVEPGDVSGLAGAVARVAERPGEAAAMGARAANDVARRFAQGSLLPRTLALLEGVIEAGLAARGRALPGRDRAFPS